MPNARVVPNRSSTFGPVHSSDTIMVVRNQPHNIITNHPVFVITSSSPEPTPSPSLRHSLERSFGSLEALPGIVLYSLLAASELITYLYAYQLSLHEQFLGHTCSHRSRHCPLEYSLDLDKVDAHAIHSPLVCHLTFPPYR